MVHMRFAQKEIKIVHDQGHDEEHKRSRQHKRNDETEQRYARQSVRGLSVNCRVPGFGA
jgi:hypothetical protein